jgi:hypothetical protein
MFLNATLSHIIENDDCGVYSSHIAFLAKKSKTSTLFETSSKLKIAASENHLNDPIISDTLKIIINACNEADILYKNSFKKEAGFITKVIIKTLKVAQAALATMLLKSPVRVAIAYNALHFVIKHLESLEKKSDITNKKKLYPLTEKKRITKELQQGLGKKKWKKIDNSNWIFEDPTVKEEYGLEIFKDNNKFVANTIVDDYAENTVTVIDNTTSAEQTFKNKIEKIFGIKLDIVEEK